MDKICAVSERLIGWVEAQTRVPLAFVGAARTYRTAPAPFIELVYMAEGSVSELAMGSDTRAIPQGHVGVHNVHFGNIAPFENRFLAWVALLRVDDAPQLADLAHEPWLHSLKTARPIEWLEKFERLARRARATDWVPARYQPGSDPVAPARSSGRPTTPADLFVKTALLDLLGQLLEDAQQARNVERPRHEAVERALDYMAAHYPRPDVRLQHVARAAGLSIDHLGRLFNQHVGEPPMRRLRTMRVDRSAFLLRHTDMRVEDVAREVGFDDPFHFSRTFKAIRGISPNAYRQQ